MSAITLAEAAFVLCLTIGLFGLIYGLFGND